MQPLAVGQPPLRGKGKNQKGTNELAQTYVDSNRIQKKDSEKQNLSACAQMLRRRDGARSEECAGSE